MSSPAPVSLEDRLERFIIEGLERFGSPEAFEAALRTYTAQEVRHG